METLKIKLEIYIKQITILVSCFPFLEPKPGSHDKIVSRLYSSFMKHNFQIDAAVTEVVSVLFTNAKFHEWLVAYEDSHKDEDVDSGAIGMELFIFVIDFVGLHTALSMCLDTSFLFQQKFFKDLFNEDFYDEDFIKQLKFKL